MCVHYSVEARNIGFEIRLPESVMLDAVIIAISSYAVLPPCSLPLLIFLPKFFFTYATTQEFISISVPSLYQAKKAKAFLVFLVRGGVDL